MPNFKVKAVYEYSSPHEDDLSFPAGQIITVTEEEDADWYIGEYVDDSGTKHDGLFPKNFVEKYEPEPPPRPNRASRHKPLEQSAAPAAPPTPEVPQQQETARIPDEEREAPKQPAPVEIPPAAKSHLSPTSPESTQTARSEDLSQQLPSAPKPAAAEPAEVPSTKKAPPPVAAKTNAFRDRIAAFNKPAAPPIQPFKVGGGAPSNFIKKPFVAPPPSRDAYVPPPREAPQVKTYRREEDPEIVQRKVQDQENAERAGLTSHAPASTNEGDEEDKPKNISLKERIAMLKKQQEEDAARMAALHKEKPAKRPPQKKRTESHEGRPEDSEGATLEKITSGESRERSSMDHSRPPRSSHGMKSPDFSHPNRELLSDANDADQSGAGDTEDAEGASTSVEEDDDHAKQRALPRSSAAPAKEPDVGDEQDADEDDEEEEDEMDAETRRKLELRERMAKMSGGMGIIPGMFGGGPPMGGFPPPKKKKPAEKKSTEDSEEYTMPQQRVPMFPMGMPPVRSPELDHTQLAVQKEDEESHPITESRPAEAVPDVEDVMSQGVQRTPTAERPPPIAAESKSIALRNPADAIVRGSLDRFQPLSPETVSKTYIAFDGSLEYIMTVSVCRRPVPPPIPTGDRPLPPPIPSSSRPTQSQQVRSPSPGSESGDEMTDAPAAQTVSSPRTPSAHAPSKRSSYLASDEMSQDSPDKRVPPIPSGSPTFSPTMSSRPPPPPPPGQPPSRQPTMESVPRRVDRNEGETDYEGDYDTDIAPGATHKDALKAHAREPSMDDSTTADEPSTVRSPTTPAGPPPLPPSVHRAVPPPPPQQPPSRASMDAPRGAPPPPPVPPPARDVDEDDEDYDPYRYTASPPRAIPPAPKAMPPPPQSVPPPPQNRPPPPAMPPVPPSIPPVPQQYAIDSSDEDDLYSSPPPRKSHDRPPPPPPQAPPHQNRPDRAAPPLPPQDRAAPPPPPRERAAPPPPPPESSQQHRAPVGRKSLDVNRAVHQGRVSMDQPRPSASQEFIASDIDVELSTHWWTQPNMPPPSLQGRKDVLIDMDESRLGNSVEKAVFVLYMDYSQTVVTARFEANDVSNVQIDQRHEPPPARLRQDQLENAYEQFGVRIAKDVESKQNTKVGDGSPHALIYELLRSYKDALPPVSTRSFGALVYANLANASTQQYDEIRPGDIISFRNASFKGSHGAMHAKYKAEVGKPDHVGVVMEWDGSKKKVRVWEQGRESKKVKVESFRMGDLRSGEVRVWRVMGKSWIGWS